MAELPKVTMFLVKNRDQRELFAYKTRREDTELLCVGEKGAFSGQSIRLTSHWRGKNRNEVRRPTKNSRAWQGSGRAWPASKKEGGARRMLLRGKRRTSHVPRRGEYGRTNSGWERRLDGGELREVRKVDRIVVRENRPFPWEWEETKEIGWSWKQLQPANDRKKSWSSPLYQPPELKRVGVLGGRNPVNSVRGQLRNNSSLKRREADSWWPSDFIKRVGLKLGHHLPWGGDSFELKEMGVPHWRPDVSRKGWGGSFSF